MTPEEYAKQKERERKKEYYRKHREDRLAYQRRYSEKHRERLRAYRRKYQKEYREGKLRRDPNRDSEE